jgi:eukaryotic-like serine/threonine-protein kinase
MGGMMTPTPDESKDAFETPTASQQSTYARPSDAPDRIGKYHILSTLGEGGFGVVYLAEQTEPVLRRVALKVIKPGMDSKAVIARFHAERQALAMMDHPCVATVYDAGSTPEGRPYFVMEHVAGVPITDHCDRHKHSIAERIDLFVLVCNAVQHAHQKGVIHRDLKPSNILVSFRAGVATPKVIDFGVAKALNTKLAQETIFTEQGQLVGTPEYMSPEQAEMTGQDIDTRSDVYSLGVILYELLTHSLPFNRETLRQAGFAEIQRIIREVEPPRPSTRISRLLKSESDNADGISSRRGAEFKSLVRQLRHDLDWIAMKCLEKDRTRRYETANALAMDLHRHLAHEPVLAGPPSASYKLQKFVRRNRGFLSAAAVIVLLIFVGSTGSVWQAIRATRAESLAESRLAQAVLAQQAEAEQRALAQQERARAEDEAAEAHRQAATAEAINRFLNDDLLGSVDPNVSKGHEVTVREVFDNAVGKLDDAFPEEPIVEANLRQMFGRVYSSLGLFETARSQFELGLAIYEAEYDQSSLPIADLLEHYAWSYRASGGEGAAHSVELMKRVSDIRTELLGADHPLALRARGDVSMFEAMRNGEGASGPDPLSLAAIAMARGMGEDPDQMWKHLQNVMMQAVRLWASDDHEAAKHIIRVEVEPVLQNRFFRARTPISLAGYARRINDQGQHVLAEILASVAYDFAYEVHGRMHEYTVFVIATLADILETTHQDEQAIAYYLEALAIAREADNEAHPFVSSVKYHLAKAYELKEQFDDAEPMYRQALVGFTSAYGEDTQHSINALTSLGGMLWKSGKSTEGEEMLRRAILLCDRADDPSESLRALVRLKLGIRLISASRLLEAESMLIEAYDLSPIPDVNAPSKLRRQCVKSLVNLYEQWGKQDKAEVWRNRIKVEKQS